MFEKNVRYAFLLDFYADVLDEHTRNILKAYYEDDLSLAEIADDEKISRQGVRHIIKKGEEALEFWDSKLSLAEKFPAFRKASETIKSVIRTLEESAENHEEEIRLLNEAVNGISSYI